MASLRRINEAPFDQAKAEFIRCCGSRRWADAMAGARPFADLNHLVRTAELVWAKLGRADWLEAFAHHPKIGDRKALAAKLEKEPDAKSSWAANEQSGVGDSSGAVLDDLAEANREYEARFGHIFIVCATGKSAAEMLSILRNRLGNRPEDELKIAAAEQGKITRIRLEKLLNL